MVSAPSYPAPLGGRFRIESELARGGMGTVFVAVDTSIGNRVALKRLAAGAPHRMAMLFEREFHVLSSLKHPRIIDVYDYGVDGEGPYYTMELLDGADLRELSPLPAAQVCRYLRDVASSLALLHARRLLHRDVSPRNVRTVPGGGCKLIDFGALMSFGTSQDLVGTPPAIPPEALSGEPMDQRADLYALGALAYFLLTGRHAYPARTVKELHEVWREQLVPPSRRAPDVSPELDQLVLALLNLDLLARPLHAGEVIDRLNAIAGLPSEPDERAAKAYFVGAALVERGPELERVNRRLVRARASRGTAVFVDAEPGVGKTRFLGEAALRAQLSGATVLRVDAAAYSDRFSTARALLQQLVRLLPHASSRVLGPRAGLLCAVWPGLLDELELGEAEAGEPPSRVQGLAVLPSVLEACLRELAKRNTLVVAVDNVDRADAESAALVLTLSRAARSERILVLVTASARPAGELPAAVRALKDAGTAIRLRDLTENGAVELVRTAFGDVPHVRRTAQRLYTGTHGNPEHCMRLLQRWVDSGVVTYAEGAWNLPLEISADDLAVAERRLGDRLGDCTPTAKQLGATMAILGRPAPLELCLSLAEPGCSNRDVIAALGELVAAEVLVDGTEGYRFVQEAFRVSVLDELEPALRRRLEHRLGEVLLAEAGDAGRRIAAGLHLIRGGEESRGAELIGEAARGVASEDTEHAPFFVRHVAALEAALAVYEKNGRSRLSRLDLLVPLVLAGYELSPAFGARYAEETLQTLERGLGLSDGKGSPPPGDVNALLAALRSAPVLDEGEERTEQTPDVAAMIGWLIRCVMSLAAAASAAIDRVTLTRYAEKLRPFTLLGGDHQAAVAYEYCLLIRGMAEDHLARSRAGWLDLEARIPGIGYPRAVERRLTLGVRYALGVLECQRDDETALARMTELEQLGSSHGGAIANQLRFLYHGFRGEIGQAEACRERVEAHAVQRGSAWQVEIWSTCTLSAVYGNSRDAAGNKRVLEQLMRLKKKYPSLELFWQRAVAAQLLLTGSFERAAEAYERLVASASPREVVGWSAVRGGLARCYNSLGKHDRALALCEETMALAEDDFDYVSLTLTIRLERCRALAGIGETERAKELLRSLLDRYGPNKNPLTLGSVHRGLAEIAQIEGDTAAFDRHHEEMRAFFQPTRNPALIAQCDRLRNATANASAFKEARTVGTFATQLTFAQSVLASCNGGDARKHRALELIAAQMGAREAWLFTRGADEGSVMAGQLGVGDVPAALQALVESLFEEIDDDANETAFAETTSRPGAALTPMPATSFRLLPLTVNQGPRRLLVGTVAVPTTGPVRSVSQDFLEEMAAQLYQAGDVATVRSFG